MNIITPLALMINDKGEIVNQTGVAIQGKGIFGHDDQTYPAGIALNGEIHAHSISSNAKGQTIIETNTGHLNPDQWDFDTNYSHLLPTECQAHTPRKTSKKSAA